MTREQRNFLILYWIMNDAYMLKKLIESYNIKMIKSHESQDYAAKKSGYKIILFDENTNSNSIELLENSLI